MGVAKSFSTQDGCDWVRAEGGAPGGPTPLRKTPLTSTPNTGDGVIEIIIDTSEGMARVKRSNSDRLHPNSGIESFGLIKARGLDHHPTPYRLHQGQGVVIMSPGMS